jgi:hypothetical protein
VAAGRLKQRWCPSDVLSEFVSIDVLGSCCGSYWQWKDGKQANLPHEGGRASLPPANLNSRRRGSIYDVCEPQPLRLCLDVWSRFIGSATSDQNVEVQAVHVVFPGSQCSFHSPPPRSLPPCHSYKVANRWPDHPCSRRIYVALLSSFNRKLSLGLYCGWLTGCDLRSASQTTPSSRVRADNPCCATGHTRQRHRPQVRPDRDRLH